MDLGALFRQSPNHFEGRRESDIVGVSLKSQPQHSNALSFDHPKSLIDLSEEPLNSLFVDAFGGFQNFEIHSNGCRQADECLDVFGETEAAKAQSSLQKL